MRVSFKGVCILNYYPHHIGDYKAATAHLSDLEDLAYRRLLEMYYDTEQPIPADTQWVSRRLRMGSDVVESVLTDFFLLTENGYSHARCEMEIREYNIKAERSRANGAKGGRRKASVDEPKNPAGSQQVPKANPERTQSLANHEPLTNNHKPLTSSKTARGTRLPTDFQVDMQFAVDQGLTNCLEESAKFRDYWSAQSGPRGVKLDWQATWRNWCRNAKKPPPNAEPAWRTEQRQRTQIAAPGVAAYEPEFFNGVTNDNATLLG